MSATRRELAWESLTTAVADALCELGSEDYLIIAHRHINHYVQAAGCDDGALRIEAVSNTYIEPLSAALTVAQYGRMAELGWRRATDDAPELVTEVNDPAGSPNFFLDLPAGWSRRRVAELLIQTLREVYGVRKTALLDYHAFNNMLGDFGIPDMPIGRRETVDEASVARVAITQAVDDVFRR